MTLAPQTNPASLPGRIETADAAEALCTALMASVAGLIATLDKETELLRTGNPHEIVALQARKAALSAELSCGMGALRQDAMFVKMAVPQRLEALRGQQEAFEKSLAANQAALSAMASVSEALLRTIAAKAGERGLGPETYGEDASLGTAQLAKPAAISVDRRL